MGADEARWADGEQAQNGRKSGQCASFPETVTGSFHRTPLCQFGPVDLVHHVENLATTLQGWKSVRAPRRAVESRSYPNSAPSRRRLANRSCPQPVIMVGPNRRSQGTGRSSQLGLGLGCRAVSR
jgi:hypothetical protein